MKCTHPLGFALVNLLGQLVCFDCATECPGRCVCGALYLSMECQNRAHLRGPRLTLAAG